MRMLVCYRLEKANGYNNQLEQELVGWTVSRNDVRKIHMRHVKRTHLSHYFPERQQPYHHKEDTDSVEEG